MSKFTSRIYRVFPPFSEAAKTGAYRTIKNPHTVYIHPVLIWHRKINLFTLL